MKKFKNLTSYVSLFSLALSLGVPLYASTDDTYTHDESITMLLCATLRVDQKIPENTLRADLPMPKSYRASWHAYDPERLKEFYDGTLKILHPKSLGKNWGDLTPEDKAGVPANMFYQPLQTQSEPTLCVREKDLLPKEPPRDGLDELNVVGVSQFSEGQLLNIVDCIREERGPVGITVFDQRQEPHGHLRGKRITSLSQDNQAPITLKTSNSVPFSLFGLADASSKGKDIYGTEITEGHFITAVHRKGHVTLSNLSKKEGGIIKNGSFKHYIVEEAFNEEYLCKMIAGIGYARIPITDHSAFEGEVGSNFRMYINACAPGTVKIFHCAGGKGRTTTGMLINDFLENGKKYANKLRFVDYLLRHYLLGGSNLLNPVVDTPDKAWKQKLAFDRIKNLALYWDHVIASDNKTRRFFHVDLNARRVSVKNGEDEDIAKIRDRFSDGFDTMPELTDSGEIRLLSIPGKAIHSQPKLTPTHSETDRSYDESDSSEVYNIHTTSLPVAYGGENKKTKENRAPKKQSSDRDFDQRFGSSKEAESAENRRFLENIRAENQLSIPQQPLELKVKKKGKGVRKLSIVDAVEDIGEMMKKFRGKK